MNTCISNINYKLNTITNVESNTSTQHTNK